MILQAKVHATTVLQLPRSGGSHPCFVKYMASF